MDIDFEDYKTKLLATVYLLQENLQEVGQRIYQNQQYQQLQNLIFSTCQQSQQQFKQNYQLFKSQNRNKVDFYSNSLDKYDVFIAAISAVLTLIFIYFSLFLIKKLIKSVCLLLNLKLLYKEIQKRLSVKKYDQLIEKYNSDLQKKLNSKTVKKMFKMQEVGIKSGKLMEKQTDLLQRDQQIIQLKKLSGIKFLQDQEDEKTITSLSSDYIYQNPLHYSIFPSSRQMETEVLQMIGNHLGQKEHIGLCLYDNVEAATLFLLSIRQLEIQKGIEEGEVLVCENVNEYIKKGAFLLKMKLKTIKMNQDYEMDLKDLEDKISKKTLAVVLSISNTNYGTSDDFKSISNLCYKRKIRCHLDTGRDGMISQFHPQLHCDLQKELGITSINMDVSHYGGSCSGSVVLLFRYTEDRQSTYFSKGDWQGGLYVTPTMFGSRNSAYQVAAWLALMSHGVQGYREQQEVIGASIKIILKQFKKHRYLKIVGKGQITTLSFISRDQRLNIYQLLDDLNHNKNWYLTPLINPNGFTISLTLFNHQQFVKSFYNDVNASVQAIISSPYNTHTGHYQQFLDIMQNTIHLNKIKMFLLKRTEVFLKL